MKRATERFSGTVNNYVKYRPGYPAEILAFMEKELGIAENMEVADLGSGTGKLAALFVKNGMRTFAIEPNEAMRLAAEQLLGGYSSFVSINGTAENTGLSDQSVDLITAGQAFHWFDIEKCRAECLRILRPGGWALLIWNKRIDERTRFMQAYNTFLENYSTDYQDINLRRISQGHFEHFFGGTHYQQANFHHYQEFDLDGVIGRYLSCSYALGQNHPRYAEAMDNLEILYDDHKVDNHVKMWYRTEIYYGKLK